MLTRILTGLVLAPLLVALVVWGPAWALQGLLVVVAARCADELVRMYPEARPLDRGAVAVLVALWAASPLVGAMALATTLLPVAWLTLCLWRTDDVAVASRRAMLGALALAYVGALGAALVAIADAKAGRTAGVGGLERSRGALLGLFVMVFSGDTGAYFAGRVFGKHKLYELISPKKTVEGALGGLASSALGGWLTATWLLPMPVAHGVGLGLACGAVGQVGDLVESLFKRATGTKDSGQLLPGHGGLLDRLDGVLFAAPVVLAWLTLGFA